jgi:colanic acid biosynthesis glycosyl transferase WcaI
MTQRILLISPFFYPEPISTGKYNTFLAKELVEKGVFVDVICFHPLYPDWRSKNTDATLCGVGIYRGGTWLKYPKKNLLRRVVLEIGFLIYVIQSMRRLKHYSQIIAVLPPMLYLPFVRQVASPKARVTAIVHDLQGVMACIHGNKHRCWVVSIVRLIEKLVLKRCHRVVALSSQMADFLASSYKIPSSKISVCWPFVTMDTRHLSCRLENLFVKDKKHIVYAGAMGEKQNPNALVYFLLELAKQREDVVCHIFSRGPIFEDYKGKLNRQEDRLIFHDLVPEDQLYELYQRSHVQIIPEKIGFSEGAVPSKLPNILASGVPILYIGHKDSGVYSMIQELDAGLCTDSWEYEKLIGLVEILIVNHHKRSNKDRRIAFKKSLESVFSIEPLIRILTN